MPNVALKPRLLALLREAYVDEQRLVASLSQAQRTATGKPEHPSAKDVLAHLAAWKARTGQILAAAARDEIPPAFDEVDRLNATTFEEYRGRSWDDVLEYAERAYGNLAVQVDRLPEDALADPERYAWRSGRALYIPVLVNGYAHPERHAARFYLQEGDAARAVAIQEAVAARMSGPEVAPVERAVSRYDLACLYALAGRPDRALPALAEALALFPGLADESRQDPDLGALHGLPAYEALYR